MKINCLSCGFKVDLDDSYDDFEGQIKCSTCGGLLDVKLSDGHVKAVKVSETGRRRAASERRERELVG
jgi:DNA-directed RNA polymerase subunit RPC12/RpoP